MTIPANWMWAAIGEISEVNPPASTRVPDDQLVSFVPLPAVEVATGRLNPALTRPWREVRSGFTRFEDGDVLFAKITPSMENGKVALAEGLCNGLGAGSTEFHVLRPRAVVRAKYLMHYVLQAAFRREARTQMKGVAGQLRVPPEFMRDVKIPLPPLAEQQRIVAAIEQQFTRLDAAVAALQRSRANLKRYRAAVLKAACEGRLVPTEAELARAEGREYESGAELLARILAERRARWEAEQQQKYAKSGKQPPFNWRAKYEEPAAPDTSGLPALPEGWCLGSFDMLLRAPLRNGKSALTSSSSFGVRVLTLTAVTVGDFSEANTKLAAMRAKDVADLWLEPGDILIERSNTPELVGTARLYRGSPNYAVFPDLLIRARVSTAVSAQFVEIVLQAEAGRSYFRTRAQGIAGTMPKIDQSIVLRLPHPLPPLVEQERIVAEVERKLSVLDALDAAAEAGLKRAERLRQAILARAFAGRLVPQDPNDEPAAALLVRIRAERGAEPAPTGGKRGRRSGNATTPQARLL